MTYSQIMEFLYSRLPAYHRIGKAAYKDTLDNTLALDNYFGHPHRSFKTIHIAGTNGKGSLSHLTASVLQEAGYRTGLYTSPHLKDFRERIRVDGLMIPEEEIISFVENHHAIIETLKPSFFEITVAMAFDHFARAGVDVAVIETGLGGRLDSTNIINPVLSVITNIGHDHMDLLGNTIEKIAAEKAGIIKEGVPVVIGESNKDTEKIFNFHASERNSTILFAERQYSCKLEEFDARKGKRRFNVTRLADNIKKSGFIPMGGDYQEKNLITLFQVVWYLKKKFRITQRNFLSGIENCVVNTGLQGRWQILDQKPLTICDTAHNKEGLEFVMSQIRRLKVSRVRIVTGFVNDKDLTSVLPLFPTDAVYYFTKASVPRALDEKLLQASALEYGLKGSCYNSVNEALEAAKADADISDLIFIGGSTFVVAEVI